MPNASLSVSDLAGLAQPATKFIEVVAEAIGVLYEPARIRRKAKADADAATIAAEAKIKIDDLELRAARRREAQGIRRQQNIDAIVSQAMQQLPDSVSEEKVDGDWIVQFFNYGQDVGNQEMQLVWARLLAGEVARPGSFSLRTLNLVRMLQQSDAQLFKNLANYVWSDTIHFHNEQTHELLQNRGLKFAHFLHMQSLGLVSVVPEAGIVIRLSEKQQGFVYGGKSVEVSYGPKNPDLDAKIVLPAYLLTDVGKELLPLCDTEPDAEYFDAVIKDWAKRGLEVQVIAP